MHPYDMDFWVAMADAGQGWALVQQKQTEQGLALIRDGSSRWKAAGMELGHTWLALLEADACWTAGRGTQGSRAVQAGLERARTVGECVWEAELWRLKGELGLNDECQMLNDERQIHKTQAALQFAEAEKCFQQALQVARKQEAKSLELRAAMSLARLWQRQGKTAEASQLLSNVYGWCSLRGLRHLTSKRPECCWMN